MDAVCHYSEGNAPMENLHQYKGNHDRSITPQLPVSMSVSTLSPIDPFEKHRELGATELYGSTLSLRPDKSCRALVAWRTDKDRPHPTRDT